MAMPDSFPKTISFSFESASSAPGPFWKRQGEGDARFRRTPSLLLVEETGTWWDVDASARIRHDFRKTFQLEKRSPHELVVGKHTPEGEVVELLTLVRGEHGRWTSPAPHLCIEDEYRCELFLDGDALLRITWWSRGPEKNYHLQTRYDDSGLSRTWLES